MARRFGALPASTVAVTRAALIEALVSAVRIEVFMSRTRRLVQAYWLTLYLVIAVVPVILLLVIERARYRNIATELSVLAGLLALSLLIVAFALPTRVHSILASFGIEKVLRSHRLVALISLSLLGLHILLAVIGDPRGISIFNLPAAPRPVWAACASTLALTLLISSALRRRRRQPRYEGWRMAHAGLAILALTFAGLHIFWLGGLTTRPGMRFSYAVLGEIVLMIAIRRYLWLPLRASRRAYLVDSVRPVSGNAVTVTVRAHGHSGLPFQAGQFAWLKIGTSPFVFEEHPFTIASTAERPHLKEFTIKALGDFSELLIGLRPGRKIYLDGPYGRFTIDGLRSSGFVFVAGGVGITPMMSMLRTLADRADTASHLLLVGARSAADLMMRSELAELSHRLNLRIIEVVQDAPPDWRGERGRIDGALLDRVLPRRTRHHDYFLCGPPAMVVGVGRQLRERGISARRIHTEQFEVV
ncbi:MAG: ferric reductase-like transmembrane domain-containing protein [Jatrophihabitantaceae bacterium]